MQTQRFLSYQKAEQICALVLILRNRKSKRKPARPGIGFVLARNHLDCDYKSHCICQLRAKVNCFLSISFIPI